MPKKILLIFLFFMSYFFTLNTQAKSSEAVIFTPEQIQEYKLVYKSPFVIKIREFLNNYAEFPSKLQSNENIAKTALDKLKINKPILKTKFIVYKIEGAWGGGKIITIGFQKYPNLFLDIWVYSKNEETYQVKDILESQIDTNKKEAIKKQYRQFLDNPKLAL